MQQEQAPGKGALHDLHHVGDIELRLRVDEHMDMVRHDLHCRDPETVLLRKIQKELLTVFIRPCSQYFPPVFGTPDDMVLERIYISATI